MFFKIPVPITLWYTKKGYNHFEVGHVSVEKPTPYTSEQGKSWSNNSWSKKKAFFYEKKVIHDKPVLLVGTETKVDVKKLSDLGFKVKILQDSDIIEKDKIKINIEEKKYATPQIFLTRNQRRIIKKSKKRK